MLEIKFYKRREQLVLHMMMGLIYFLTITQMVIVFRLSTILAEAMVQYMLKKSL
jgi:hypothetical protein